MTRITQTPTFEPLAEPVLPAHRLLPGHANGSCPAGDRLIANPGELVAAPSFGSEIFSIAEVRPANPDRADIGNKRSDPPVEILIFKSDVRPETGSAIRPTHTNGEPEFKDLVFERAFVRRKTPSPTM
jgi:hypothetical protein